MQSKYSILCMHSHTAYLQGLLSVGVGAAQQGGADEGQAVCRGREHPIRGDAANAVRTSLAGQIHLFDSVNGKRVNIMT